MDGRTDDRCKEVRTIVGESSQVRVVSNLMEVVRYGVYCTVLSFCFPVQ